MSARITKYGDDDVGGVIVGKHYKGDSGADVEGARARNTTTRGRITIKPRQVTSMMSNILMFNVNSCLKPFSFICKIRKAKWLTKGTVLHVFFNSDSESNFGDS